MAKNILLLLMVMVVLCGGQKEVKDDLHRQCYSVGTCMPPSELDGPIDEICSLLADAVRCMQRALAACHLLHFPSDTLKEADGMVQELRHMLAEQCSPQSTTTTTTTTTNTITTTNNNNNNNYNNNTSTFAATTTPKIASAHRGPNDVTSLNDALSSPSSPKFSLSEEIKASIDRPMKNGAISGPQTDHYYSASWKAVAALCLSLLLPALTTTAGACGS